MAEHLSPAQIVRLVEERGRDGRQVIFELDLPDKIIRICAAIELTESAHVRRVLCNLLASLADPAALPCLLDRLSDPDPGVVAAAADAVGNSAHGQDIAEDLRRDLGTKLSHLATDPASALPVRTGALYALGLMRYREGLPTLLEFLEGDEPAERWASAEALAHVGDRKAIPALQARRRQENDERVKRYIDKALAALTDADARQP